MELPRNEPSESFRFKRRIELRGSKDAVKMVWYSLGDDARYLGDTRLELNEAEDLAIMLLYLVQEARNETA